jgi:hypothetical protein
MRRAVLLLATVLTICWTATAQTKDVNSPSAKPVPNTTETKPPKSARETEAERLLKERRANAQSLLINLAADARSFNDMITRGRTLARIASVLWNADRERARALFRLAWDAAVIADKETLERVKEQARQSGAQDYFVPQPVRHEVIRLATRRDRALGEEFLANMKEDMRRENGGVLISTRGPLGTFDPLINQRLDAARQLLEADETQQALEFADPVLGSVSQYTVDFLSSVREISPIAADERYAIMLLSAAANTISDANTVSVLSSYLFTPHSYVGFDRDGTLTRSFPGNRTPPDVTPQLRTAFFRATAAILLRPLAPPGEEQTTAGHDGHYLVIKRLMPLFEQYAPPELTASLKVQLESLSALVTNATRDRDDDDLVRKGIRLDNMMENWEQFVRDRLDHAKNSTERDSLYLQLASLYAGKGDLAARDFVDEVADPETRKDARVYIDIRLARYAVAKKDVDRINGLIRTGELNHIYKTWLSTQAAKLSSKSDNEKAASLVEAAVAEARRISPSDVDAPRAFLAAANAMFVVNRSAVWETMNEAVKNANAAEKFTGEDGELNFRFMTKAGPSYASWELVPDFDLDGIFRSLADFDYDKTVELARGLNRDAPRSAATIAIARAVLEPKKK